MALRSRVTVGLFLCSIPLGACASDVGPAARPKRGSIGEETFGVLCDRVGAQSLREDLGGDSFRAVCHRDANGAFADKVDVSKLPAMPAGADRAAILGRARSIARIEALARHRADLIAALDALVPAAQTVTGACTNGEAKPLSGELATLLARMSEAYDDGTVPQATRSLGRLMNAIKASPDAQGALERLNKRAGYRPESVALGLARPALAYPRLRDLANATLALISPEPAGPAYPTLRALSQTTELELANATAASYALPLTKAADAKLGIDRLSRPRTSLELLSHLMSSEDLSFGGGAPRYVVRRDVRGMATVAKVNGVLPAPFVDTNADGLADVDPAGRFVLSNGAGAPSPFFRRSSRTTRRRATPAAARSPPLRARSSTTSSTRATRTRRRS